MVSFVMMPMNVTTVMLIVTSMQAVTTSMVVSTVLATMVGREMVSFVMMPMNVTTVMLIVTSMQAVTTSMVVTIVLVTMVGKMMVLEDAVISMNVAIPILTTVMPKMGSVSIKMANSAVDVTMDSKKLMMMVLNVVISMNAPTPH